MEWQDEGLLLARRPHGETSVIIDVLTASRGLHSGLVRGGQSGKMAATLQPGAQLALEWRGRLEEHLGNYHVEPLRPRAAMLMEDRAALAAFNSMAALILAFVPEREPDFDLYEATLDLVDTLCTRPREWPGTYVRWEAAFLATLGFGLDLTRCAATGVRGDLAYVSPRTGRAVSREAGGPYAAKLLPLPPFLAGEGVVTMAGVRLGMRMVGWFLENRVCPAMERDGPPEARERLMVAFEKLSLPPRPPDEKAPQSGLDDLWSRRLGLLN
ncbi:MAG: DNA repair protein RecO [Pseudomonadota bacterium]